MNDKIYNHKIMVYRRLWKTATMEIKGTVDHNERILLESKLPEELICDSKNGINITSFATRDTYNFHVVQNPFIDKSIEKVYGSCAIVTNSDALTGSSLGHHIDANDFVIRFNHAEIIGYEVDVGSKTSLRITSYQSIIKHKDHFPKSALNGKTLVYLEMEENDYLDDKAINDTWSAQSSS